MGKPELECPDCGWPRQEWHLEECSMCGWRVSSEPSARNEEPIELVPVHRVQRQFHIQTVQHNGPPSHTVPGYPTAPILVAQQPPKPWQSASSRRQEVKVAIDAEMTNSNVTEKAWFISAAQREEQPSKSHAERTHWPLTISASSSIMEGDSTEAGKPLEMTTLQHLAQENRTPSVGPASDLHAERQTSSLEPGSSPSNSTDLNEDEVELVSATDYSPSLDDDVHDQIKEHQMELVRRRARYLRDCVMYGIQIAFDSTTGIINCTSRASPSHSRAVGESSLDASSGSNTGSRPNAKRRQREEDDEPSKDDEENGQNRKAKRQKQASDGTLSLACPFYKRDPRRCHHRACTQSGFSGISRLKEHLRRDHRMHQCLRCWAPFATLEDLEAHSAKPTGCSVREVRHLFAINQSKWELIGSRVKPGTKEEQWRHMFTTIFPYVTEGRMPSPYYELLDQDTWDDVYDDFESNGNRRPLIEFKAFLGSHLARKFEEKLMKTSNTHTEQYGDTMSPLLLPEHLKDIVQEALAELEREFERPEQVPSNTSHVEHTAHTAARPSTSQYTQGPLSQDGSMIPQLHDWNPTFNLNDFNYDNFLLDHRPEPPQDSSSYSSSRLAPMDDTMPIPPVIQGHQLSVEVESRNEGSLYPSAIPNSERDAVFDQLYEASSQTNFQPDKHRDSSPAFVFERRESQWTLQALFGSSLSNSMSWSQQSEDFP